MESYICKHCGKICKNYNSLVQHEIRCKENPNRIKFITTNFEKYNKLIKAGERHGSNQFIKAKKLGLPKPEISAETRYKLGKGFRGKHHSQETKDKLSTSMRRAVEKYPESYSSANVNGRVKKYIYNGVSLDGRWELLVAMYLDEHNIEWERPKTYFEYTWNNSVHKYFPDFYLPKYNYYIEVKGYKRDRDDYKWKSINNLIVLQKDDIEKIVKKNFNIFEKIK